MSFALLLLLTISCAALIQPTAASGWLSRWYNDGYYNNWDEPSAAFWIVVGCAAFILLLLLACLIYWWCCPRPGTLTNAEITQAQFASDPYLGILAKFRVPKRE